MDSPYGLPKAPDYSAVCQPSYGLTLLHVGNLGNIQGIARYLHFDCFDLLYKNRVLVVTAADGIYPLDAADEFLVEFGRIRVGAEF